MKKLNEIFESKKDVFLIYIFLSLFYYFNLLITGKLLQGSDYLLGVYAAREWISTYLRNFYLPLWFPFERLGYSIFEAFWMDIFTPTGLLRIFLPTHIHFNFSFFFYTFLAGFSTYLLLKEFKLKGISSFFGGILYSFSGALITNTAAGHLNRLTSAALLPLVLYFLYLGVKKKRIYYFIFAGFTAGWQFLGGQFQMTYFSFLLYIPFFFYAGFKEKLNLKEFLKVFIYAAIGLLVTFLMFSSYAIPIWKNLSYVARGTERGYSYSASWPLPPIETFDIIFINFAGFLESYWGPNYFRLNHYYIGFFPFLFLILSFYYKDKKNIIFFFVAFLITLTFAWGGYFVTHRIFYYLVPGISKFRGPSNIFFITTFCFSVLSAYGFEYVFNDKNKKLFKNFLIVSILILLFILLFSGFFKNILHSYVSSYKISPQEINSKLQALQKSIGLFRGNLILLIVESGIILSLFYLLKEKFRKYILYIFPLITFFEVLIFIKPHFLKTLDIKSYIKKDEIISYLENKKEEFRVFYFPGTYIHENDGILTLYNIEDLGGYVANPLRRYQELIGADKSVMFNPQNLIKNRNLLNILNAKYVILPSFPMDTNLVRDRAREIVKFLLSYIDGMELVLKTQRNYLFKNNRDFGRFFVKGKILPAESEEEALSLVLKDNLIDSFVIVEKKYLPENYKDYEAENFEFSYEIMEKKPDYYKLRVKTSQNVPLVFSMNYHPAWNVYIDNKKVEKFPADYALIGVLMPKGEHTLIFRFGSKYHFVGIFLTLSGFLITIFSLALFYFRR